MVLKFNDLSAEDEKIRTFRLNGVPHQFIVIGCGGTGGYVIPDLFRAIRFAFGTENLPSITLIDGDIVEGKNIQRQNFIEKDLGQFKAEVMAKRYGQAFGLEVSYINNYLENTKLLNDVIYRETSLSGARSLVISCVDSLAARKLIFNFFKDTPSYEPHVWIDSGNEDTFGQVILSLSNSCSDSETRKETITINSLNVRHLPSIVEIFPHILTSKESARPVVNCAIQAEERPQNILINRLAATIILGYAYKVIYNQAISSFMTTFDVNKGIHDELITFKNMRRVWKQAYPDLRL